MNYNLTDEQYSHFESAKWLYFGPRAVGRTHVIACAIIDYAIHHQGEWVDIFDHHRPGSPQSNWNILHEIQKIVDQNNLERQQEEKSFYEFKYGNGGIIFKGMKHGDF